jgi:AcrR family transcriptional regulator
MSSTKDYIVDQAFSLFLQHSYEAVSINDISKLIGLTKGALYHHFTSKEELFKAVIDKYLVMEGVKVNLDNLSLKEYTDLIVENVREMVTKIIGNNVEFRPINYLTLIADSFRHYPGYADEKLQFFNSEITKTKIVLVNAMKRGEIRSDINPSVMAQNYFSCTVGLAGNLLQNYSIEETLDSLKAQFNELYKLLKK